MARKSSAKEAVPENIRPASAERGELFLTLDGAELILRPSHDAIEAFEGATGRGLIELARAGVTGSLKLGETAQIATHCIRAWGRATGSKSYAAVDSVRVAELMLESEGGYAKAINLIGGMLAMACTGGYTAQGEVKAGTTTTSGAPAAN